MSNFHAAVGHLSDRQKYSVITRWGGKGVAELLPFHIAAKGVDSTPQSGSVNNECIHSLTL